MVRKNTLPYVKQWAVVDTGTGSKVGDYKTQQIAQKACENFIEHELTDTDENKNANPRNTYGATSQHMKRPEGDKPRSAPQHSRKRPVELN